MDGDQLRDEGVARVADSHQDWMGMAAHHARAFLCSNRVVTGEQVRVHCLESGIPLPASPNAWGALVRSLASAGEIEATTYMEKPRDPSSHSRMIRVWKSKLFGNPQEKAARRKYSREQRNRQLSIQFN
jgi:hypothetical protein